MSVTRGQSQETSPRPFPAPPQDAVSFKAEPEPAYSMEAAGYREAAGQQGLAYAPDAVYEAAEAPGHYQAGTGGGAPATSPTPLLPCENVRHLVA